MQVSQKWRTNGVEEITVNVRKMLKKFYWTYLPSGAYLVGTTFAGTALKKQK
jgi:hypothetical protein